MSPQTMSRGERFCKVCGDHLDRSGVCETCIDNMMEAGADRDVAEEAYLAMRDDTENDDDESSDDE